MTNGVKYVPIGDVTVGVKNWNPQEFGARSFDYIDLSSVDQGEKKIVEARRIVGSEAPSRARQLVEVGDVLVSTVRPNLNGVARVTEKFSGATASTGFCVLRPTNKLDSRYLYHWVRSQSFVGDMVRKSTGANYPAVTDRTVRAAMIPLVGVDRQRWIADVLDRVDTLRAWRQHAVTELDALASSVFTELLDEFLDSPGCTLRNLGDVADIASGVTKGRKLSAGSVREVPYLAVANVQDRRLDLSGVKYIEATDGEVERYRLRMDDLVLTEGGDPDKLGRGSLWRCELPEAIHQNHIFRVRVNDAGRVHPVYLNWLISSAYGKRYFLRSAKQTTGIASINMSQLRRFPVVVPDYDMQKKFAEQVDEIERSKAVQRRSLGELDALFASLQHRAFRGEL